METEPILHSGQFSILVGEAQDSDDDLESQKSKDFGTMEDY